MYLSTVFSFIHSFFLSELFKDVNLLSSREDAYLTKEIVVRWFLNRHRMFFFFFFFFFKKKRPPFLPLGMVLRAHRLRRSGQQAGAPPTVCLPACLCTFPPCAAARRVCMQISRTSKPQHPAHICLSRAPAELSPRSCGGEHTKIPSEQRTHALQSLQGLHSAYRLSPTWSSQALAK